MKQVIFLAFLAINIIACQGQSAPKSDNAGTTTAVAAKLKTDTFKVWGNCGMCKKTIEKSLKVPGIAKSDWSIEQKVITVTYNPDRITLGQIQKNVAAAGYDNDGAYADDNAYKNLHECCQYDRKPKQ